ncbi:MAG TPA: ParB/RepB/Spo0J family partition protein, partial [Phycisphaerales bacterium]|nr:ParB/RepB/Spo0J family partition protein [Phycisphaerales bacterium]
VMKGGVSAPTSPAGARVGGAVTSAADSARGGAAASTSASEQSGGGATPYVVVRVDEVIANRFQPRQEFDDEGLRLLAASIKRDGVMQPLVVRRVGEAGAPRGVRTGAGGGAHSASAAQPVSSAAREKSAKWELIAGERRWRAAQLAGLTHVPAVVVEIEDVTAALWAVVENVQRVDLGPLEKSAAYARLSKEFGLTQQQIADQVGEDRTVVSHYIRLGDLEPQVLSLIRAGKLSFGHGKVLNSPLVKPGEVRVKLAERAARETLSVRQLEQLVQRGAGESLEDVRLVMWSPQLLPGYNDPAFAEIEGHLIKEAERDKAEAAQDAAEARARAFEARANVRDLEEQLGKHLGTKVKIRTSGAGKRGVISIEYYSLDHFDGLVSKMGVRRES